MVDLPELDVPLSKMMFPCFNAPPLDKDPNTDRQVNDRAYLRQSQRVDWAEKGEMHNRNPL